LVTIREEVVGGEEGGPKNKKLKATSFGGGPVTRGSQPFGMATYSRSAVHTLGHGSGRRKRLEASPESTLKSRPDRKRDQKKNGGSVAFRIAYKRRRIVDGMPQKKGIKSSQNGGTHLRRFSPHWKKGGLDESLGRAFSRSPRSRQAASGRKKKRGQHRKEGVG